MNLNKILSSAGIFSATMPSKEKALEVVKQFAYKPVGDAALVSHGFLPLEATAELVTPMVESDGYVLVMRTDTKKIPQAAVKEKLKKEVARIEARDDRKIGRKEKLSMKHTVIAEMAYSAPVVPSFTYAFFDPKPGLLMIQGNAKLAQILIKFLVEGLGTLETKTLHVSDLKHGLTTRLVASIKHQPKPFGYFELGSECKLEGYSPEGKKTDHDIYW
jgi:recombination associated protein RdgC